jgi:hypothetical protein
MISCACLLGYDEGSTHIIRCCGRFELDFAELDVCGRLIAMTVVEVPPLTTDMLELCTPILAPDLN